MVEAKSGRKTRLVKIARKLIQINSENPPGNERKIAEYIFSFLKAFGYNPRIVEFSRNRSNIVCRLKPRFSKKSLLICPHLDTVPAGRGWKYPPFSGKIVNSRIYGRGASDCKANLSVSLETLARIKEEGIKFNNLGLIFAATADEETGSSKGFVPLLKRLPSFDYGLILDGDNFEIVYAQKGVLHLKIEIRGEKAHGAYPERGRNAIEGALKIYNKLQAFVKKVNTHFQRADLTLNIGRIEGGEKVNIVADRCFIELDFRYFWPLKEVFILRKIKEILRESKEKFSLEILASQPQVSSPKEGFLSRTLTQVLNTQGLKPVYRISKGATVLSFLIERGIEALVFGFGSKNTAHTTDEYVKIDNLFRGVEVLKKFLIRLNNSL